MERWRFLLAVDRELGDTDFASHFWKIRKQMIKSLSHSIPGQRPLVELTKADVLTLNNSDLITRGNKTTSDKLSDRKGGLPIRTFTVLEEAKGRRRWITHTASTNHIPPGLSLRTGVGPDYILPISPAGATTKVLKQFGACVDFAAYFHQFALDGLYWWFYTPEFGKWFITTIPTGSNFSPAFAQVFTTALATLATRRSNCPVDFEAYIDNIRFTGDILEDVQKVVKIFYGIAAEAVVTINEALEEVLAITASRERYTFLGVQYDHPSSSVALSEKLTQKIEGIPQSGQPPPWSMRSYLSAYGCLGYAALIHKGGRAPYYHATKLLRRRVGRFLDSPANIWQVAWDEILRWRTWALSIGWRKVSPDPVHNRDLSATIFTDASNTGLGVVLFSQTGEIAITARRWSSSEQALNINVKEALALRYALHSLDLKKYGSLEIFIDNTAALGALRKTHSGSWELNAQVLAIMEAPDWPKVSAISYVKSALNHADLPSRLQRDLCLTSDNPFLWGSFKRFFTGEIF